MMMKFLRLDWHNLLNMNTDNIYKDIKLILFTL